MAPEEIHLSGEQSPLDWRERVQHEIKSAVSMHAQMELIAKLPTVYQQWNLPDVSRVVIDTDGEAGAMGGYGSHSTLQRVRLSAFYVHLDQRGAKIRQGFIE